MSHQRYHIFFSLEKIAVTHSLDFRKICIFFFRIPGKKKNAVLFFFFPEKDYKPLTQFFWMSLYKKIGGKLCFFKNAIFNHILRCIFFSKICIFFLYIFFSWKRLNFTHSLISNLCILFSKYSVFAHSLDLGRKCHKSNF